MKAIFHYQESFEIPKLDNDIQMAFLFFKNQRYYNVAKCLRNHGLSKNLHTFSLSQRVKLS